MSPARSLAFVAPRFAEGPTVGGAETLIRELATHAAAAGRRVTILSTCARSHFTWANELPPGPRRHGNVDVILFPVDEDRDVDLFLKAQEAVSRGTADAQTEAAWIANSVNSKALCRHLAERAGDYDRIVAGPYLFGLTLAVARTAPDRTILLPCLHDEPFARVAALAAMFRAAPRLIFNSEPERDLAVSLYGLSPDRCAVVGMGLDPFDVDPAAFARRRAIDAPYVMYAGRREPLKGTPLLLDYLAAFRARTARDVKLVLSGSGNVEPPPELAPHVLDAGFLPEEEKREAMAGALAFIHPSVNESLSIVLLEAWMARTAALVHGAGAVLKAHCRKARGGLWFANYPEFEEELLLLVERPDTRHALAENGRRYVLREYAWPSVLGRLLEAVDAG